MEWVIDHGRMAVGSRVKSLPERGDRLVLYASRGAFHNPTRDRARVIGLGITKSAPQNRPVVVAGSPYERSFGIEVDQLAEPREGLDFVSLVPRLDFIVKKESWGGALRRPVVRINERDYKTIASAFMAHMKAGRR